LEAALKWHIIANWRGLLVHVSQIEKLPENPVRFSEKSEFRINKLHLRGFIFLGSAWR
jgi:hypothetical protein